MELFSKEGVLLLAQTDHLSGEELGSAVEYLYAAGAANVQVIPTVTKKNRPGHIFLTDVRPERAEDVERAMVRELGISGWHRIGTEHRHLAVDYERRAVTLRWRGRTLPLELEWKTIRSERTIRRPEHRSCAALREALEAAGRPAALSECRAILTRMIEGELIEYEIQDE